MANIVRCVLPDGVRRFKPFTVEDYRDFIFTRIEMIDKSEEEQKILMDELLDDYYHEEEYAYRPYIFLQVFLMSIGKTKIPIQKKCEKCGSKNRYFFDLEQKPLKYPTVEVAGVKVKFKFPNKDYGKDIVNLIVENILEVEVDNTVYKWEELDDESKVNLIDAFDINALTEILSQLKVFNFDLKTKCCGDIQTLKYDNILDIFKLLIHQDEIFTFYPINHRIVKSGYTLNSVMKMLPVERSMMLSLIEKETQ